MTYKLPGLLAAYALIGAAFFIGGGCTPTVREFANGGGGQGGGGQGGGCPTGFAECDGNPETVCETNIDSSNDHCGTCDKICSPVVNAEFGCVQGMCSITSCTNGLQNCDNFYENGCETNPDTSFDHCGMCGNSCQAPDAITACVAGTCQLAQCVMGKLDCDKDPKTGCEVDPTTNVDHCGDCATACALPNSTMACVDSKCSFVACLPNFADCNGNPNDGCEVDLTSDPHNCNACGMSCNGGTCKNGVCNSPILVGNSNFPPGKIALFKNDLYIGSMNGSGQIASMPAAGGPAMNIGNAQGSINAFFINFDGIYAACSNATIRLSFDGASKINYGINNSTSRGIFATATDVYWTAQNTIRISPIALPTPTNFISAPTTTYGLTSDPAGKNLYWTLLDGSVWNSPIASPSPQQIAMGPSNANNIVTDGTTVYWSSNKAIHSVPAIGGTMTDLAVVNNIASVALDAQYLYWTDQTAGLVQRIIKDGSMPVETVALDQKTPYGLDVDAQYVYWSESATSSIWKIAK